MVFVCVFCFWLGENSTIGASCSHIIEPSCKICGFGIWCAIWMSTDYHRELQDVTGVNLFFTHGTRWSGELALPPANTGLNAAPQTETGPFFPPVAWVNGKSHIPTIPGWSSVLHLKAYLTFHSSIHSPWACSKTLSPAKISFWQTMKWIKGHTWPLSCSLGDQTHFQGQELLTGLFNPQGETRHWR